MEVIRATWKNGQIVPDGPVDWPEGCRLVVEPEPAGTEPIGGREENWSDSPEAVSDWLRWYDSLEPLEITPQEEADLAEWRQKVKQYSIAKMQNGIEGLSE
ncbi:MAG: hypothetical protein ACHRXM_30045 [Isosphaerales bacterium]